MSFSGNLRRRFLTKRNMLPRMFGIGERQAIDVFLFLWRPYYESRSAGRRTTVLDLDALAESMGLAERMDRNAYRGQLLELLRELRDAYGLIEFNVPRGRNGTFRMVRGGLRRPRKGTGVEVPVEYWDYGWCRKLSTRAKLMYLICLAEQKHSNMAPFWQLNQVAIAKKYTTSKYADTISAAVLELEQLDILAVGRFQPEEGKAYHEKPPNIYLLKPLMSDEQIESAWQTIRDANGDEKVEDARRLSGMLDRPNSRESTLGFIYAIDTFGLEATEEVTREVAKFARHNPLRNVGTVIYRLRKRMEEKKAQPE